MRLSSVLREPQYDSRTIRLGAALRTGLSGDEWLLADRRVVALALVENLY